MALPPVQPDCMLCSRCGRVPLQSARAHAAALACAPSLPLPDDPSMLGLWAAGLSQQAQAEAFQGSLQGLYVLPLQVSATAVQLPWVRRAHPPCLPRPGAHHPALPVFRARLCDCSRQVLSPFSPPCRPAVQPEHEPGRPAAHLWLGGQGQEGGTRCHALPGAPSRCCRARAQPEERGMGGSSSQ